VSSTNRKPNLLFAIADDASHMSAYGHRFVNTPHFDRIAREGLLFYYAYTTNPKCAPSRASILTVIFPMACSRSSIVAMNLG
jgi:N-sulfoglucosamine sulfohydrolase